MHHVIIFMNNHCLAEILSQFLLRSTGPSTFGLPSNPTMVTSGSIVDTKTVPVPAATTARPPAATTARPPAATTARPPVTPAPGPITTVPEAPTTQEVVPSKCIQIVPVTEDGAEVTGTNGQILTEIRTVVIEPNRNDAQAGDTSKIHTLFYSYFHSPSLLRTASICSQKHKCIILPRYPTVLNDPASSSYYHCNSQNNRDA